MGAPGLAVLVRFCFAVGMPGAWASLLWQLASRLWRRCSGRVAADYTGRGHCSLHHGPVCEHAVVFDCGVGLDCSNHAAEKICACGYVAAVHRADPSFNGCIRIGVRWSAGMETANECDYAATFCSCPPVSGAVPAGHGRISTNPRRPSVLLSAALAMVRVAWDLCTARYFLVVGSNGASARTARSRNALPSVRRVWRFRLSCGSAHHSPTARDEICRNATLAEPATDLHPSFYDCGSVACRAHTQNEPVAVACAFRSLMRRDVLRS